MRNARKGMSLAELIIAAAITAVITGLAMMMLISMQRTFTVNQGILQAETDIRAAALLIAREIHAAESETITAGDNILELGSRVKFELADGVILRGGAPLIGNVKVFKTELDGGSVKLTLEAEHGEPLTLTIHR
ncbi:hypothetical protein FACS18949_05650 [Clostridia bacterium]|nr:hypothetical protein FACS18949_05650 [Clostridia bacterium]